MVTQSQPMQSETSIQSGQGCEPDKPCTLRPAMKPGISRRDWLAGGLAGGALAWLGLDRSEARGATRQAQCPVAVFSKVYQELKLSYEDSAELTADAGLDGIDCPVRPGGQVLPERVEEDLPRFAEAMKRRGGRIWLLTTGIKGLNGTAEKVLRTAKAIGVTHYRLGYWNYTSGKAPEATLAEMRAELKDLAALNRELGMCALLQNHAGGNLVGAKVRDLYEVAKSFDASQIAIAFDIGHAIHELDQSWATVFEQLRSHFRIAYVKDWKRGADFVPFGEGEIGGSGFFSQLRKLDYRLPVSMHLEYPWAATKADRTRGQLLKALQRDKEVLQRWLGTV